MIGEVLGSMAGGKGGLRSGPASNRDFAHALHLIEKVRKYFKGGEQLHFFLSDWINNTKENNSAIKFCKLITYYLYFRQN